MAGPSSLLPPLQYHKGLLREPKSGPVKKILSQLQTAADDNEVKKTIKQLVTLYISTKDKKVVKTEARYTILELFTKYNSKRLVKKFLTEQVTKNNLVLEIIETHTQYTLEKIRETKICDLRDCNEFVHFISVVQASPNYDYETNFKPLFPFYMALYDSYAIYASQLKQDAVPDIEELNVLINSVLKQILPVFVKHTSYLEEIKDTYLQSLLMYSYILLYNGKIGFNLRTKVCLTFVYSFSVLEGDHLSVAQLISKDCSQFSWSTNDSIPADYHIILYSSILSVLPEEKILSEQKIDDKALVCVLFDGFMETAKSNAGDSHIIIETSKALCQIAKHLKNIPIESLEPLFLEGLFFVWSHADHLIDTVRSYSRHFFEDLVDLAASFHDKNFSQLAEILLQKIAEIPDMSTLKFFAYEYLATYFGCEFLLQSCNKLPETLLELMEFRTIGEQVCRTYINLLDLGFRTADQEDKDNLYTEWAKTWVFPVVQSLNFNKICRNFYQRIITSAFKLQPAILRMIYPNDFVGSTGESAILLHCLHYARKNGIELSVEKDSNLYWRGLIDKQKMEMFMIHQDEQIRLLVLASVTESQKSTELFLDWEFIYLINYIRYNIAAQSPNVRKQIISYYKKVLLRYDAGYRVILRNIDQLTKCLDATNSSKDKSPPKNMETSIENKVINNSKILLTNNKDQKEFLFLYQELKKSYRRFICNFTKILIGNLSYDSNYPRRATSLEILLVIKDILTSDEWKSCWNEDDVKNSHNILFDTYENNKKMAVALLRTLPPHYLGFMNSNFTFKYLQRSFDLALDVKPSKTLSAAYLFEMCTYSPYFYKIVHGEQTDGRTDTEINDPNKDDYDPTLDMVILLTRKLLNHASEINLESADNMTKSSIYGFILSVRHMLENRDLRKENKGYAGIFEHLVSTCFEIQEKIMPVVCNPSPEGYLPDGPEEICETDETSRAQMILVYAWRTVKEMTLLLAEIVKQCIVLESQLEMLPEHLLLKIGEFFVNLFIQSKHRGVFEQAYVGFSTICEKFWISKNETINTLPRKWLEYALSLCTGKEESNDLIATRRSAGLPFLILSILTTVSDAHCFHHTMDSLIACAKNYENTPNEIRMHCLNVLRAIYRHSKLGELVGSYVGRGVILAIHGYKSEDWGVRNSSTLLYATLITRMFGVQRTTDSEDLSIKNKLTLKVFYLRFPELYSFLLITLSQECHKRESLVLHPILMILARLYASNFDENGSQMAAWLPHVNKCLSNSVFRTRELAARASVPLIDVKNINRHLEICFKKIAETDISDNECHGILLQIWHLIKNSNITDFPQSHYLASAITGERLWIEAGKRFSFMTVNLFTDIITQLLMFCGDFEDLHWLKQIVLNLSKQMRKNLPPTDWRSKFASTRFILVYFIIINKLEETDVTYLTITHEIMSYMYGNIPFMKKFSLYFMIALNQTLQVYLDPTNFKLHPLFSTREIEIPPEITSLVATFDRLSIEKILRHIHPYIKAFLMEELKREHYIKSDDRILMFLLLDFYPCAIRFLRLSKQETFNTLLSYCHCDNEELVSAVLSCISTFLCEVDYNLLRYDKLLEVLSESASPAALVHRRLAVCDFLCKNYYFYCNEEPILRGGRLCAVFDIILILLEDEDSDVRHAMSHFENAFKIKMKLDKSPNQTISGQRCPVVPEKAKEDLFQLALILLPEDMAVCFIFSWACRYFPDPASDSNDYEIFERGGLNQYAENTPIIDISSRLLIKRLWTMPEGLSYEDKSIFLEEQTQVVTLTLLNALLKYESPMMNQKTKLYVIVILKSVYKFLEVSQISSNFPNLFRTYLNETISNYTENLEQSDLFCVKKIIRKLYDPVFRSRK